MSLRFPFFSFRFLFILAAVGVFSACAVGFRLVSFPFSGPSIVHVLCYGALFRISSPFPFCYSVALLWFRLLSLFSFSVGLVYLYQFVVSALYSFSTFVSYNVRTFPSVVCLFPFIFCVRLVVFLSPFIRVV